MTEYLAINSDVCVRICSTGVRRTNPNCSYHGDLDAFNNYIIITLKRYGHILQSNRKGAYKYNAVSGRKYNLKEFHCAARDT